MQTSPGSTAPAADVSLTLRFHVPVGPRAWWGLLATLGVALALARLSGADRVALAGLALAVLAAFVAQDWAQALLAALLRRGGQAQSHWMAPPGWFLAGLSLGGGLIVLQQVPGEQRGRWLLAFGTVAVAATVVLIRRVLQPALTKEDS